MNTVKVVVFLLVAAVITAGITGIRLWGELQGWNPAMFSKEAGGGGALVGISWLVLPVGYFAGRMVARNSEGARPGRSALGYLLAMIVMAAGLFAVISSELLTLPSVDAPGKVQGMGYGLAVLAAAAVVAWLAWPKLTTLLIAYGFLARLPVVAVTYFELQNEWGTHYGQVPPGAVVGSQSEQLWALVTPQLTLWPLVFTPIVGGLCGCLGARFAGRR